MMGNFDVIVELSNLMDIFSEVRVITFVDGMKHGYGCFKCAVVKTCACLFIVCACEGSNFE